jgi:hypothetical protein
MADNDAPTRAQQLIGDFAPKLVSLTDDVLFGDIWERTELCRSSFRSRCFFHFALTRAVQ